MPTPEDDLDTQAPEAAQPPSDPKPNWRRDLEARASRADQLERENAILKSGLTGLTDRQINVLASQIEGDVTPEAVRSVAAELGWAGDQPKREDPTHAEELAALDRVTQSLTDPLAPPRPDAVSEMEKALNEGGMDALMAAASKAGLPTTWEQQ